MFLILTVREEQILNKHSERAEHIGYDMNIFPVSSLCLICNWPNVLFFKYNKINDLQMVDPSVPTIIQLILHSHESNRSY